MQIGRRTGGAPAQHALCCNPRLPGTPTGHPLVPTEPSPPATTTETSDPVAGPPEPAQPVIGPMAIFTAFSALALSGFGGVLPFAYRALVEKRGWLDAREFASLLAIAQVMPGPTICNLSVMIGQRYAGFAGSCAALAGMVLGPSCVVIALGIAWQHFGELTAVKRALGGMSAVAIGLIFSTAVKMGVNLFRPAAALSATPATAASFASSQAAPSMAPGYWNAQRLVQVGLCVLGFIGVGLLRWPLAAVVAGLAPIAIGTAWLLEP